MHNDLEKFSCIQSPNKTIAEESRKSLNSIVCGRVPRLTSDNFMCCHTETEGVDHGFCLSRSHYTDTDPNSRKRAPVVGFESTTARPEVALTVCMLVNQELDTRLTLSVYYAEAQGLNLDCSQWYYYTVYSYVHRFVL